MPGKLEDLVVDWRESARPLLMIDEVRKPTPVQSCQYILYTTVVTDTRAAVIFHDEAQHARLKLSRTPAATMLKGRTLFGNRRKPSHEPMRDYVFRTNKAINAIWLMLTTNIHIQNCARIFVGGIDTPPAAGETRMAWEVNGPELVPLMNMVKHIALNSSFGNVQVDVLIDRLHQLGLDPASRLLNDEEFETLGPSPLNSSPDGNASTLFCPSAFRFVSVSDTGPFRDLLLLPDAISYIANLGDFRGDAFDRAKSELDGGTPFSVWRANLNN